MVHNLWIIEKGALYVCTMKSYIDKRTICEFIARFRHMNWKFRITVLKNCLSIPSMMGFVGDQLSDYTVKTSPIHSNW